MEEGLYRGEFKNNLEEGYGHIKYENNDEYDGKWKAGKKHGEGVYKEAKTGKVQKVLYEKNQIIEIIEEKF